MQVHAFFCPWGLSYYCIGNKLTLVNITIGNKNCNKFLEQLFNKFLLSRNLKYKVFRAINEAPNILEISAILKTIGVFTIWSLIWNSAHLIFLIEISYFSRDFSEPFHIYPILHIERSEAGIIIILSGPQHKKMDFLLSKYSPLLFPHSFSSFFSRKNTQIYI